MYIIAIAWLYVTILMAATEASLVAGLLTFLFYGLGPLALFLWLFGTPQRRRRQRSAESASHLSDTVLPPSTPSPDQ
ncbi:MAG: hypothetical protein IPH08_03555 [Rhodocyclaceae bacterium]|jgi:sulfite exporter TauE/SafE|nr:hypothetical protein [Rhodocyclaceae bacterium]MBK6906235.1 hypothetical protein [Rhodocyclaceae bacterium]